MTAASPCLRPSKWWHRLDACSDRPLVGATQPQYPAHHVKEVLPAHLQGSPARPTEGMGQLCFPLCRPRVPGAHVCRVFVATTHNATARSDRLRRCKPPPHRKRFLNATVRSGPAGAALLSACRACAAAPVTTHQMCIGRDRGPRPQATALCADLALNVGMRWDGGGLHRQAGPGREQLVSRSRFIESDVPSNTRQQNHQRLRLDAGPSTCWWYQVMPFGFIPACRAERRSVPGRGCLQEGVRQWCMRPNRRVLGV